MRFSSKAILVGGVAVLLSLTVAQAALATHARPKSASPTVLRLLPAYAGCGVADRQHEPPVSLSGCAAVENSPFLTFNAPDRPAPHNTGVDGVGYVSFKAFCTNGEAPPCPAAGEQEDIAITLALQGVRCRQVSGGCTAAGGTYAGKVLIDSPVRITDHRWDSSPPFTNFVETGNTDYSATFGAQCSVGTCNLNTTLETIIPGSTTVLEGKRQSLDIFRFLVYDGGVNGNLVPTPAPTSGICPPACQTDGDGESVFLRTGVYAP